MFSHLSYSRAIQLPPSLIQLMSPAFNFNSCYFHVSLAFYSAVKSKFSPTVITNHQTPKLRRKKKLLFFTAWMFLVQVCHLPVYLITSWLTWEKCIYPGCLYCSWIGRRKVGLILWGAKLKGFIKKKKKKWRSYSPFQTTKITLSGLRARLTISLCNCDCALSYWNNYNNTTNKTP